MDLTSLPPLSLDERLVLRTTERKDMFEEKFRDTEVNSSEIVSRSTSAHSLSHIAQPSTEEVREILEEDHRSISSSGSLSSIASKEALSASMEDHQSWQRSKSRTETVGSSEEWVGSRNDNRSSTPSAATGRPKDTHWYDTKISYCGIPLPIRIPLGTFPEEVGDASFPSRSINFAILLTVSLPYSTRLSSLSKYFPTHLHYRRQVPITPIYTRVVFLHTPSSSSSTPS